MKKQKGQAIVEFALVLPLFLMLVFGLVLSCLFFADYMTLSNVARSSAREASLQGSEKYGDIRERYQDRANTKLITNLYQWPNGNEGMQFETGKMEYGGSEYVKVTIKMNLNSQFPGVKFFNEYITDLPASYSIQYSMHDESGSSE